MRLLEYAGGYTPARHSILTSIICRLRAFDLGGEAQVLPHAAAQVEGFRMVRFGVGPDWRNSQADISIAIWPFSRSEQK